MGGATKCPAPESRFAALIALLEEPCRRRQKQTHPRCLLRNFGCGEIQGIQVHLSQSQPRKGQEGPDQRAQQGQDQFERQPGYGPPGESSTRTSVKAQAAGCKPAYIGESKTHCDSKPWFSRNCTALSENLVKPTEGQNYHECNRQMFRNNATSKSAKAEGGKVLATC